MEDPGLIFLTFEELFARIKALEHDKIVDVSITYLEIYNETIRDLLIPGGSTKTLHLREDANKQISVAGLSTHNPESVQHVMEMILMGNGNRTISPTEANAVSSRSHAVLQVNISQKARTANISENHTMATLSIIDLAGSERASVTKNRGERLLEGANINRSLLALGNCINALCDPHRKCHIPYRDSKLTRLLKFSLGGNCRTVMVVCVSPSSAHYDETHNTLKYGNRAKNIKTKVSRNVVSVDRHVGQYVKIIYDLRQEVEELKKRLESVNTDDVGRLEKEQRLQALRYEDAMYQLQTAFSQHTDSRSQRPRDIASLKAIEHKIATVTAWMTAFNMAFENPDYQEGLDHLRPARDQILQLLRDLEYRRQGLEHNLRSCQTLAAIDTVSSSILRNNKGDSNKVLCRAVEVEAKNMKSKIAQESFEAEIQALELNTDSMNSALQKILTYSFQSVACLKSDTATSPEEEIGSMDEIYRSTYDKGLSLLSAMAQGDHQQTSPGRHHVRISKAPYISPVKPTSPLKAVHRLSSSSSPRPSPRSVRVRGVKGHTVFPKKTKLTTKKSVQWADVDEDSVQEASIISSPGNARMRPDFLNKRRSMNSTASPPVHKKSKLDPFVERSLRPIDSNTETEGVHSNDEFVPISSAEHPMSGTTNLGHERKRSLAGQPHHAKAHRTTLSGLAMANLTVDMDGARRISRDKENDRSMIAGSRSASSSSLSNPLRQSLAGMQGRPSKTGSWR